MTSGNQSSFISGLFVGSVIESSVNVADTNWLRCDGSTIVRTTYPTFSAMCGLAGTFTGTIRTLNATPTTNAIATNGTTVVASATTGTNGAQVSSNSGVTWAAATMPASINVQALCWNGTVYVAGAAGAQVCQYSTVGTGTWTVCTGAVSGVTNMAANTSTGAMVLIDSATGSVWSSPSSAAAAPAFVTSALASGSTSAAMTRSPIVYSGTQFILFSFQGIGQGYQTSAAGLTGTWTAFPNPPWGMAPVTGAVSDGANNVLVVLSSSSIAYKSTDGGTTWRQILLPGSAVNSGTLGQTVSYANGRWFVTLLSQNNNNATYSDGTLAVSSDLNYWSIIPSIAINTSSATAYPSQVTYQGSNYIISSGGSTISGTCVTSTEDTTKMYLPLSRRSFTSGIVTSVANYQEWIKVQ